MKRKNVWYRWIAWGLLLIMCMNSVGTITLAAAEPVLEEAVQETLSEEETVSQEETPIKEESLPETETVPQEEIPPQEESLPETETAPQEETVQTEESLPETETLPESETGSQEETQLTEAIIPDGELSSEGETITEDELSSELQEPVSEPPADTLEADLRLTESTQGFDIDFYIIIDGGKVRLQHNGIPNVATWKDGNTTYHGICIDDLIAVYQEFGFIKGNDGQNPAANEKFVSATRGKNYIEYGKVYTEPESGKTYVSYNYDSWSSDKRGVPVDVYYLPNGMGGYVTLESAVKRDNSFYAVEVKGEGKDQIRYALRGTTIEMTVSDYNSELPEQTDRITWTCFGAKDDTVVDGTAEAGDQTRFTIGNITQPYVIRRADTTEFDVQFYVYVDNEIRKLPSDSLKKVYKWNNQGRSYVSVSDLAEIYKEYGLKETDTQYGSYFPYAVRGEKTLAHAAMDTHNGKQYVSYTLENQYTTVPTDVYYMPKGADKSEKVPENPAEQLKENRHSFYSVTVIQPDGSRTVTYHKKDENVIISVDQGETKATDWLCASADETKTIPAVENTQEKKLEFTIQQIEQPYTIACNTFSPATLNIKLYTFVNHERYNVEQAELPVLKDTTSKPGTTYYYLSNDVLKEHLAKFHYDGQISIHKNRERFYYSKRDYDTIYNAGQYTVNGIDCIYIGKTGEPMDVYYLPYGQELPVMNVGTLLNYEGDLYDGFYSVIVQDDDGQVYNASDLVNLPAVDFVARKTSLTRTVSTKPRLEGQTGQVNWECRREDGTLSGILGIKDEEKQEMSFTIPPEEAVRPYVIVPDNTEKPKEEKEANISFYVFIDGDYKLIKNINATQYYITKANSGRDSRYYLRAKPDDTVSQIYKEFGFTPDKLEPGADGKEKILFGYSTDTRVFVQHPYKDKDGTWYIPVLKNGHDVSVYYFAQPNPLNPDKIENYFDRLTGLSSQVGVAGRHFSVEGSFHLIEVMDPLNLTKGQAILRQYVSHGENYSVTVPKKATLEGEYQGKDIVWSCTSDDKDVADVLPKPSEGDTLTFEWNNIGASYKVVADKPQDPDTVRVIYDTTRYMKKLPKEAKLTPQVGNKTRFIEDIPTDVAPSYKIKSPYPLTYDHEDNNSKELEQYVFDHWDYKDSSGHWQECYSETELSTIINDTQKPIIFYAAWSKVSDRSRKQVQFYICKSAMPEDGSVALPSINEDDYTSAVAVANCNVAASLIHDVPVLGNKNPSTWEHYANGHKRVMQLLQGTKPDPGGMGNGDYIYKIDRIPSDEEVFQTIRESGRKIRIGDREIPSDKLDTEFFTIYWYSFKSEMSDGWHIDGRIVAKNGSLTVKKDFVGTPEAIEAIKKDYYISVDMDERLSDGTIQPPAFHQHMKLVLPPEGGQTPAADTPEQIVGTWDDETHTSCTWTVKADPFWKYTLKEHNYKPTDQNVQFSGWYNVHNSHESGENVNTWEWYPESGVKFTGRGMGRGGESLTVELENRYQKQGVLTLNKFDASTGQGMQGIIFDVSINGVKKDPVTTDKNGIAELAILLQDEAGQNRTATETYLLRETNVPIGYIDTGDVQITVQIADGAFKITEAKLVDRKSEGSQGAVTAPPDGKIDGKSVLTLRGDTCLNIRNFSKTCSLHIKKTWENRNDALTEKQVKVRLYHDGISTGQEMLLNEANGWECTIDKVPLFLDKKPVQYKIEEIEIGKTHYSPEFGDGFLYYEVIYPEAFYKDKTGQALLPKTEEEFQDIAQIELEVQNLHFNLAERSFLKTDDLPKNRLAGAKFLLYKVPFKEGTLEYADDTGYTVEYENGQSTDPVVLKKDGKTCEPIQGTPYVTNADGMLQLPNEVEKGRYWMVETVVPNKENKAGVQYKDNLALYLVDVEDEILFLYEKPAGTNTWKPLTDRHVINHPHKGGVTVQIKKEVTGPFGNREKPFRVDISYREDGMLTEKTVTASLKHGDPITLSHVAFGSDIQITEHVDVSKYDVSLSRKDANGSFSQVAAAAEDTGKNTASMTYRIDEIPRDLIELKITNKNTEDAAPDTGIHIENSLYVWMLIIISISSVFFFWRRKKNRAEQE
ncbi:MAG: SpaA isopeptide-forming pilin-related protein [Marvinbryantia sp.]